MLRLGMGRGCRFGRGWSEGFEGEVGGAEGVAGNVQVEIVNWPFCRKIRGKGLRLALTFTLVCNKLFVVLEIY